MPYLRGNLPLLGDRVQHASGQAGTVTYIGKPQTLGIHELLVAWDFPIPSLRLVRAREFRLISRGSANKAISRTKLAQMLLAQRNSE